MISAGQFHDNGIATVNIIHPFLLYITSIINAGHECKSLNMLLKISRLCLRKAVNKAKRCELTHGIISDNIIITGEFEKY